MTDQPQQPEVIDPDNVPETLCEGSFNIRKERRMVGYVSQRAVLSHIRASAFGPSVSQRPHPG
jgi:hypothetical protein